MRNTKKLLKIAAQTTVPVLLCGESGVGKEVAARFLHGESARAKQAFIAVNCGALPKSLLESLLEGAVRGAYTGATDDRPGLVRAADRGTLFLDEIGELPLESQSRLLRILQEKAVLPIGAARSIPVNFRLICATNRDLKTLVRENLFREDLFFRLNVFPVRIPPLRERSADFEMLVREIWEETDAPAKAQSSPLPLSDSEKALLKAYSWPGNIRQLQNVLQRYRLLRPYGESLESILNEEQENSDEERNRATAPDWSRLEDTLRDCGYNKSLAARQLGISRGCLSYQVRKHSS